MARALFLAAVPSEFVPLEDVLSFHECTDTAALWIFYTATKNGKKNDTEAKFDAFGTLLGSSGAYIL